MSNIYIFPNRNCLDPKSFNNPHLQPAVNPVRHLHLPAKSVDDSSDVSSWGEENFSTTGDESSSTKGCDFGVILLPSAGECFSAIGCKSSSKESSITDLTSSHFNCQGDLTNPELKGLPDLILCMRLITIWLQTIFTELSAPKLVKGRAQPSPERPSKLELKGFGSKPDQQSSEYRKVSLGSPMGPSARMLLEQTSPRPFRKVDDNPEEDHEPLSKSRKESAHSSPSKTVAANEQPQEVRFLA